MAAKADCVGEGAVGAELVGRGVLPREGVADPTSDNIEVVLLRLLDAAPCLGLWFSAVAGSDDVVTEGSSSWGCG